MIANANATVTKEENLRRLDTRRESLPESVRKQFALFIKEIYTVRFFKPDGNPKKEWKMFYGDSWDAAEDAARGAARGATRGAAWLAAWNAVWNVAGYAAREEVGRAAEGVARNAAEDAARYAVGCAVEDAAKNVASDVALLAGLIIVGDLDFKGKAEHMAYAQACWEVWQKGYGLYRDVDGVLYVYCKGKPPEEQTMLLRP